MPSLRELQQRFADDLTAGNATAAAFGLEDGTRLAVYRRTIMANYRNAMGATYPVVRRIVGTSFFRAAADAYAGAHPSRSGDLNEYGDAFGAFLERYAPAAALPYLPDVARLEWAIDETNRAADSPFVPGAVIRELSQQRATALPGLRLLINPACRFVSSVFPLLRIWQVNQPDYPDELQVDFTAGPDHIRIHREPGAQTASGGIAIERLGAGHFGWLSALGEGVSLAEAIERARSVDPTFDLQSALHTSIADGTIAGIDTRAIAGRSSAADRS